MILHQKLEAEKGNLCLIENYFSSNEMRCALVIHNYTRAKGCLDSNLIRDYQHINFHEIEQNFAYPQKCNFDKIIGLF